MSNSTPGLVNITRSLQTCSTSVCAVTMTYVLCDATTGAITLNLPASSGNGRPRYFKKIDATANACTVTRNGTDTIDGSPTFALGAQYEALEIEDSAAGAWSIVHTAHPVVQNLPAHNFATSTSATGAISGAQPAFTDISGTAQVAQGGTGATSAGPTAANNIGALARASNLSDLANTGTARTNLGLGTAATINTPISIANGGTGTASPGGTAGTGLNISGSFPTQQYSLITPVAPANGGTGTITLPNPGQVPIGNAGGTAYTPLSMSGDATLTSTGAITVTKTNGVSFAPSATTDTTNASNISSGTLAAARGGAGAVNGILKANGSGAVSQAVSSTDYAPATSGSSILKGNGTGGFSNAVSGTDYQAPISGNSLAAHNFANSISSAGAISGAQPAFSDLSGSATAAQMPAFTGDTTTSAGSTVTTTSKVNGGAIPLSATALASNGSNQIIAATVQGNGAKVQLSTGVTTANDCVKYDASGNAVDSGGACGGTGAQPGFVSTPTVTPGSPATATLIALCSAAGCTDSENIANGTNVNALNLTTMASGSLTSNQKVWVYVVNSTSAPSDIYFTAGSGVTIRSFITGLASGTDLTSTSAGESTKRANACGTPVTNQTIVYTAWWDGTNLNFTSCGPSNPPANIGVALGGTGTGAAPTSGQIPVGNAGGTAYAPVSVSGDGSLTNAGALTVTKTSGTPFAASATTDTTNASNISSGTLAAARGGAGTVSGILKANGSGTVSAAVSSTDYAPATSGSAILKGNGTGGFANAVSGTDYQAVIAGNTLATHNFATSISSAGTIAGAQPAFTDVTGIATVAQGGTQCGAPSTFAGLPSSPTTGEQCSVTDAPVCGANAIIAAGGGALPCLLVYNGTNWVASGGSTGVYDHIVNNGTTGTTAFHLFTRDASNNAVNITAGATSGAQGICINSCGTTSSGNFLVTPGDTICTFDAAHAITRNDYIGISATVTGDCTDLGATPTAGQQIIGQVETSAGTGPGNFGIYYYGPSGSTGSGGGTPGGSTGSIQYNNAGALGGASIAGLVKGNGASVPTAAVANTDYQTPVSTNGAVGSQWLTGFTAPNTFTRSQPAFTDISGTAAVSQGGTQCAGTQTSFPGTPATGETCYFTNASACTPGTPIVLSGSTPCQGVYNGTNWLPSGGASGGSASAGGSPGNPQVNSSGSIAGIANIIHAGSGTLAAAFAAVPQTGWVAATHYTQGALVYDGANTQRVADWEPGHSYAGTPTGDYIIPGFGNAGGFLFRVTSAGCTSGTTHPATWNQSGGGTTTDGTCTWTNQTNAFCVAGGSAPTWSTLLNGKTVDNTCNWTLAFKGAAAPSVGSMIVADPGQTYNISTPIAVGMTNVGQTLFIDGGNVHTTDTGGAGQAGVVEGNWGKVTGRSRLNSSLTADSTANVDSVIDTATAYFYSALGVEYQQVNADISHINVSSGTATIGKAVIWLSGVDGDGLINDIYVNPPSSGATIGILVDDAPTGSALTGLFWNGLNFQQVFLGMGSLTTGLDVECGTTSGSSGSNLVWNGGEIVDPTTNNATWMKFNGVNANCRSVKINAPYFEGTSGTLGTELSVNNSNSLVAHALYCNAGSETNCVKITGVESGLHVDGYNTNATNAVNDTNYGVVNTSQGQFTYDPVINGMNLISSSISASGTTPLNMHPIMNKFTLTASSTLDFTRDPGGDDSFFATAQSPTRFGMEVCQNGPGNFTLGFGTGTGVSNIYWSGGAQPGYTLTAGNGDWYSCLYDGASVRCQETMSNQPC